MATTGRGERRDHSNLTFFMISLLLIFAYYHTHTHTHTKVHVLILQTLVHACDGSGKVVPLHVLNGWNVACVRIELSA